jgi:hypothetical protein
MWNRRFVTYAGTMQETCLRLMGKKMLVALMACDIAHRFTSDLGSLLLLRLKAPSKAPIATASQCRAGSQRFIVGAQSVTPRPFGGVYGFQKTLLNPPPA